MKNKHDFSVYGHGLVEKINSHDLNYQGLLLSSETFQIHDHAFILYRDLTRLKLVRYLGAPHRSSKGLDNTLAQDKLSGEWVVIRKAELFQSEATKILEKLNRLKLIGDYTVETLCIGEKISHDCKQRVVKAMQDELELLQEKGIRLGEPNLNDFIYDPKMNKAHVINFDSAFTRDAWIATEMGSAEEFDKLLHADFDVCANMFYRLRTSSGE